MPPFFICTQHKGVENVQIEIIEIDNELAEEKVRNYIIKSNFDGSFDATIDSSLIEDIEDVSSIKLLFRKDGFKKSYQTIGPITRLNSEKKKSVDVVNNTYSENLQVYLVSNLLESFTLSLASFSINSNLCIFEKSDIIRSQSPFANNTTAYYFSIKDDLVKLKQLANSRHTSGSNPVFERVFREVRPLIIAISNEALNDYEVQNNPVIKNIFSDTSGVELFKVLIPGGKSFTSDINKLTNEDIQLRLQIFRMLSKYLKELEKSHNSSPILKAPLLKYGNVFRGFFEPVFTVSIRNNGKKDYLLKKIVVDVKAVEIYLGEEEKGKVPIVETFDILIEPKVGLYDINLTPVLHIFPENSINGFSMLAFNIRLISDSPYLHSYLMQLKFITEEDYELLSPLFVIDM